MGVYMGDVFTQAGQPVGDAVNRAARLQAIAPPGGVCMSAGVFDEVRSRLTYTARDMGDQSLKGFDAPVRAHAVTVYTPAGAVDGSPTAGPATRSPYVPRFGKEPTDQDKQRFARQAFQTIRGQFGQGVQVLEGQSPRVTAEVEDIDTRRFVARVYVDGREEAVVTIWVGPSLGGGVVSIGVSDQDQGSAPGNSYSEVLTVQSEDGRLFLAAMMAHVYGAGAELDPTSMTLGDAAEYLWRRFVRGLER
jgi:hypothetical protein